MGRQTRLRLIRKLENLRGSRVITYITGDRRGLETRIASDVFSFVLEHLENMVDARQIDLFLYTPGGAANAGTGLVALIREFCEKFSVIIPFKAHSAGTLIALGADSIVLTKVSQLSPVDPSIQSPYNPPGPGSREGKINLLPVSVEEVIGYLRLAREEAHIEDDEAMASVFKDLSSRVHPLALGNVFRARAQIAMLSTQLLLRHMGDKNRGKVKGIVDKLTRELYSHDYIIGRKEAKEVLELNVDDVDDNTEKTIWQLYKEYEQLLELTVPLSPALLLGNSNQGRFIFTRAVIESALRLDAFQSDQQFTRVQMTPPGAPAPITSYQAEVFSDQWVRNVKI